MSKRVILVEDNPGVANLIVYIINHLQLNITHVESAELAAVSLLGNGELYDAAIVDLALPGKDGLSLVRDIRAVPRLDAMPCIAITAYHSARVRKDALDAGFQSYFSKPINVDAFTAHMRALLD